MEEEKKVEKPGYTFHLFGVNLLEKLVVFLKGIMTSSFLAFCIKWFSWIGHLGIIAAAVLGFLFTLIFVIRTNSFRALFFCIAWILLIFVVQYTAKRFLSAGENLIKNNPSQLSSQAFLDCFGLLALMGGIVIFIDGIIDTIQLGSVYPALIGLGIFAFLVFLALAAFNPKEITINIVGNNSAGQEAIGIITFFIKALMVLVPIFFGVFIVIGFILLLIAFFGLFGGDGYKVYEAWNRGYKSAGQILRTALIPFLSYIIFALYYLIIDVIKAILSVPEKLDKLGK